MEVQRDRTGEYKKTGEGLREGIRGPQAWIESGKQ